MLSVQRFCGNPAFGIQVFTRFTGCLRSTRKKRQVHWARLAQGREDVGVSIGQRPNFKAYPLPKTWEEPAVSTAASSASLKGISANQSNTPLTKSKLPPLTPAAGFLLLDSSRRLLWFNAEALQILSFPEKLANIRSPEVFLAAKIGLSLTSRQASGGSPFVTEFRSGRRRYLCRAFRVDTRAEASYRPAMALLLERGSSGSIPLAAVCAQFSFTRREREALGNLLQGLSSKEIADRMKVSPSTVKVFLRLIMVKMGVSSRSAILGKIITARA